LAGDGQSGFGGGGGDELDDDQVANERLAAPVLRDEREQAMLYLVPLARAGRHVVDRDFDLEFVPRRVELHDLATTTGWMTRLLWLGP